MSAPQIVSVKVPVYGAMQTVTLTRREQVTTAITGFQGYWNVRTAKGRHVAGPFSHKRDAARWNGTIRGA